MRHACLEENAVARFFSKWLMRRETLGRVCCVLFFCMVLPMLMLAPYAYPADDDFAYALGGATAWKQTGSLWEVAKACCETIDDIYHGWEGRFASVAYLTASPLVFSLDLYWISCWFLLALLCASLAYFVKALLWHGLHCRNRHVLWMVFFPLSMLLTQFAPKLSDSVFWNTGGVYTVPFCVLLLILGMLFKAGDAPKKARSAWLYIALSFCAVQIGGGSYPNALSTFVALTAVTVWMLCAKHSARRHALCTLIVFCVAFAINLAAPGNAVRLSIVQDGRTPLAAIAGAVLKAFELFVLWCTPQCLAVLLLVLPAMWLPLRASGLRFRRPLLFFVFAFGFFAATLVPNYYTNTSFDLPRLYNIVFFSFALCICLSALYAEGWLIRLLDARCRARKAQVVGAGVGSRYGAAYLALCVALVAWGTFAYGFINVSSICAAKSLVTDAAVTYRRELAQRQQQIVAANDYHIEIAPLTSNPYLFKIDTVPEQTLHGRLSTMKQYLDLMADP